MILQPVPTEAEWEYACRAGTTTRFPTGNDGASIQGMANVGELALRKSWPAATWTADWDDGHPFTAPVGSFQANGWGIHDMIGNVGEWCEDRHDVAYYANSPKADPRGPATGEFRVVRGGGWYNAPSDQRASHRGSLDWPTWARSVVIGFRVVRED
jgi:formylglycine-generating enzyme